MDLASLSIRRAENGEALHLRHPVTEAPLYDADGAPLTVQVIGQDSSAYRRKRNELIEKRPTGKLSIAYLEAEGLDLSVACVAGWSENIVLDGNKLAYSETNVRRAFVNLPWMREQVDAFCAERANFLKDLPSA